MAKNKPKSKPFDEAAKKRQAEIDRMAEEAPEEKIEASEPTEEAPEIVEPPGPPKGERFVCNRYRSYKIAVGNRMIVFQNGEFVTEDPEFIKAIKADPYFNLFIIPDNTKWRKRRR